MVTIRRWYIYLVTAVSLNVVAWAVISLAQDLATGSGSLLSGAFQVAVSAVGLPVYLVHWLWAQRLAHADPDERRSTLRAVYLHGMQAGFLAPLLAAAHSLLTALLTAHLRNSEAFARAPIAIVVLALLWFYHRQVDQADEAAAGHELDRAVRRLYVLGFSATGYVMVALGSIHLLRWLLYQINAPAAIGTAGAANVYRTVATLLIGLPLWLSFWTVAQRAFRGPAPSEARSALRKFYLYALVFNAVLAVVTHAGLILAGLLRRLLDLPSLGDVREPLPVIFILTVAWAYHAGVLRFDAAAAGAETPRAAGVRRLYRYLVAAIGLGAALTGLGGLIGVVITTVFSQRFGAALAEGFAVYTAALIAGLSVWVLPWRQAQLVAVTDSAIGQAERQSAVRKLYLYFFLFAATMTFLASAVYILYTVITNVLGASLDDPLIRLTTAVAYCLIAVGLWLYHGGALRADGRRGQLEQAARLSALKVAVADVGEGEFGQWVVAALKCELPDLPLETFGLTPAAALRLAPANGDARQFDLAQADLIVGPWTIVMPGAGGAPAEAVAAISASPARKLLAPLRQDSWQWAGVDAGTPESHAVQLARAVRQVIEGEEVRGPRPLSAGAIFAIAIAAIAALIALLALLLWLALRSSSF